MIDPRAVVDPQAELHPTVQVGPYSVIGPGVRIAAGTVIGPHVVIRGHTDLGRDNRVFQFASVGEDPQDMKYGGETTRLEIGDRNTIREFVTINRGTEQDAGVTRIGDDNLLMAYTHVAHDCRIGNRVILANAASLGGHVQVDDWAILGGFTIVHQFCHLGAHCFCAMGSVIAKDVPPYVMLGGHPAKPRGINTEGLRRRGFGEASIRVVKRGYKTLYKSRMSLSLAMETIAELAETEPELAILRDFLAVRSRSILR